MKLFQWRKRNEEEKREAAQEENAEFIKSMVSAEMLGIIEEDVTETEAVNLFVNSNDFSGIIHAMGTEEVFKFIDAFLKRAVPIVYENGGFIVDFRESGMEILILNEYKNALSLAVLLCGLLSKLEGENGEELYADFSIGMSFENVIVRIVGNEKRRSMMALSVEAPGLSAWLQSIACKYYAKIIATNSCLGKISDASRFNIRFLGYIYIKSSGRLEKIYDVFEGDEYRVRNKKRQTKIAFEKGVELYSKENYREARRYFIEVLKSDLNDRAAREYIYLCEKEGGETGVCIESY